MLYKFAWVPVILLLAGPLQAEESATGHGAHLASQSLNAATDAFNDANMRMHRDMAIEYSGDPDVDFVRGMIAHHRGAVEMAEIVIKFGKNARIRALAENIIKTQKEEIAFMEQWLSRTSD
ncbi:MAG: DUF305 domain-containing protein [Hyphomicrobiales bacterium]